MEKESYQTRYKQRTKQSELDSLLLSSDLPTDENDILKSIEQEILQKIRETDDPLKVKSYLEQLQDLRKAYYKDRSPIQPNERFTYLEKELEEVKLLLVMMNKDRGYKNRRRNSSPRISNILGFILLGVGIMTLFFEGGWNYSPWPFFLVCAALLTIAIGTLYSGYQKRKEDDRADRRIKDIMR